MYSLLILILSSHVQVFEVADLSAAVAIHGKSVYSNIRFYMFGVDVLVNDFGRFKFFATAWTTISGFGGIGNVVWILFVLIQGFILSFFCTERSRLV